MKVGSIDELLGPAEGRFFGEGFRKVEHTISQMQTGLLGSGRFGVSAEATLSYPASWSTKKTAVDLKPHLSTIDAFVLAAQLIDVLLVRSLGLSSEERAAAWLRAVEFRSGTAPLESLERVPIFAGIVSTARARNPLDGPYQSVVEAVIGAIKVRLIVCHDVALYTARAEPLPDVDAVLGPQQERFYGSGYKAHVHRIGHMRFGGASSDASARILIERDSSRHYQDDLGGAYRPSVSIVDCIVSQAQIAQALMYKLDDLDRSETNTLWMRKVIIETRTPIRPLETAFDARTIVESSRLLALNGGVYRSTEFSGCFQGLVTRYSLAHELPSSAILRLPDDAPMSTAHAADAAHSGARG